MTPPSRRLRGWAFALPLGLFVLSAGPAGAQAVGGASASASAVEGGGPDVAHVREDSLDGLSLSGTLAVFGNENAAHFDASGLGTPDFRLRGALFREDLILEFSAVQRAYLVGGDARFAWDPASGALDGRVPAILSRYLPFPGSGVGRFDPNTLSQARSLLPEGSPGWSLLQGHLGVRTASRPTGFEVALDWSRRRGTVPRTFVAATGFTPFLSPVTEGLPVGAPLGVLEVPERLDEKCLGFTGRIFGQAGSWRWEGSAAVEQFAQDRPLDAWENPFPGPGIRQPRTFDASSQRLRLEGKSPSLRVRIEYHRRVGEGEAGHRAIEDTRAEVEWTRSRGGTTWFLRGAGLVRGDRARFGPQGLNPVFAGPFYDLLGRREAEAHSYSRPVQESVLEGGFRSKKWGARADLRDRWQEGAYAGRTVTLGIPLRWAPARTLTVTLRPFWTWASHLHPEVETAGHHEWEQAANFRPADARNWRGATASMRWAPGICFFQYSGSWVTSPSDLGLRGRSYHDLLAGARVERGPWKVEGSLRLTASAVSLSSTTYALPGDTPDPRDPTHRAPMDERWVRRGGSARLEVERALEGGFVLGFLARAEIQRLSTREVLDDGRRYGYWKAGLFGRMTWGILTGSLELGAEGYNRRDPAFDPPDPPPGPYLWAGLSERPGTRGFARFTCSMRF